MRIIARLDIKNEHVIKGIHLEGLRKIGDPNLLALKYYNLGVDEIFFMDAVASLYDRNSLFDIIEKACCNIFVPITVGGGLRSVEDIEKALSAGADKVSINTGAVQNISLIEKAAYKYGSQCIVGSIEAKKFNNYWQAFIDNGREPTGLNVVDWAYDLQEAGCGEILVTSVDQEGTCKGFDNELVGAVNDKLAKPVIVSGGYGGAKDVKSLLKHTMPSAIAVASMLHYGRTDIDAIRAAINIEQYS